MDQVIWIIIRRMRPPFLVLIAIYSIAVIGMVMVPGIEVNGETTRMDFFHALYFVSYTSTTIGFGELPLAFSQAQRMWAMVCMYLSVIAWLYSIGSLLSLLQEAAFRQAVIERQFARSIRKIKDPFYLLCGYGEAGAALVSALTRYQIRLVVIDRKQEQINALSLHDQHFPVHVPGLCADAGIPEHLLEAGLKHRQCSGVIALTDEDRVNLKIAITSKLLNPNLQVIARVADQEAKANVASFGTEHIVDAFEVFGKVMALALGSPNHYLLSSWLTGIAGDPYSRPAMPPRGKWIVCGYGRFGHYLLEKLEAEGMPTVVIEPSDEVEPPPQGMVIGRGTEADTLIEAGIRDAVGIIAGTDNDSNNLSIIMTARELNPGLFTVARQNLQSNNVIFDALEASIVMNPGKVLADRIKDILTLPRLSEFLHLLGMNSNHAVREVFRQLDERIGSQFVPELWVLKVSPKKSPAVIDLLSAGEGVRLSHLLQAPESQETLPSKALMLIRGEERVLMPEDDTYIKSDDRILFCGHTKCYKRMLLLCKDPYILYKVVTGDDIPRSAVLRWATRKQLSTS